MMMMMMTALPLKRKMYISKKNKIIMMQYLRLVQGRPSRLISGFSINACVRNGYRIASLTDEDEDDETISEMRRRVPFSAGSTFEWKY